MSKVADECLNGGVDSGSRSSIMVMHTGTGGQRYVQSKNMTMLSLTSLSVCDRLPINDIVRNIPTLHQRMGSSHKDWLEAAQGICTTDTFPKVASQTFTLPSSPGINFSIAGITKGAGMIHPNMATTLGIICTDAPVTPAALQQLLSTAADKSYNCISIDGDTSTNDMVVMIANGAAGGTDVEFQPSAPSQSKDFGAFQKTLIEFMADMAKLVVRDGEGATKFVTIRVRGSPSYPAAKLIASVIARSVLVKTAIYGKDPSWGGILAALGYSLVDTEFAGRGIIVPELTSISFVPVDGKGPVKFLNKGVPTLVDEETVRLLMDQEDVEVVVDLRDDGIGNMQDVEEAVYWTCDLTHDFVTINEDFTK